jgi:tetratricopeptide (TPR) repeat protein
LATAYTNRGALALSAGRAADALADGNRAVTLIEAKADAFLTNAENRHQLADVHVGRAAARAALGRHADAVKDWDRAIALAADRPDYRVKREKALARAGDPAAARAADELARSDGLTPEQLCGLAGVYAVATGETKGDAARAEAYAVRAVELVRRAVAGGYPRDRLANDADLAALRGRPDFPAAQPPAAPP